MLTLRLRDMKVRYGPLTVIEKVNAEFRAGEMTAIIGRNGIGKTSLIKAVAGMIRASGEVDLRDGDRIFSRKDIAYVPQMSSLDSGLTVFEMVLLGLVQSLKWRVTEPQRAQVMEILEELGLSPLAAKPFRTLSGGQKQLVSMAQSLVSRPKVLLLDEPTSALDLRHQLIVMDLARKYTREHGAITIFVVHDLMLASRYSDKLLLLHDKTVKICDTAEQVLQPRLLQDVYSVEVDVERTGSDFLTVIPLRPVEPAREQVG